MKGRLQPQVVTLAIMTTITIVFWVFFSVYTVLTSSTEPNVPAEILAPLTPELDTKTLSTLDSKIFFSENEIVELVPVPQPAGEAIDEVETPVEPETESTEGAPSPVE